MHRFAVAAVLLASLTVAAPAYGAATKDLWGLTTDNRLVRFDPAAPAAPEVRPITGLPAGEQLLGIAQRIGAIYAIGRSSTAYRLAPDGSVEWQGPTSSPMPDVREHLSFAVEPSSSRPHMLTDTGRWFEFWPGATGEWPRQEGPVQLKDAAQWRILGVDFFDNREWAVDTMSDALVARFGRSWSTMDLEFAKVGPLGVDVEPPVSLDATGGCCRMVAGGRVHTVDPSSGAATVGPAIGGGVTLRDVAAVGPPRINFMTPESLATVAIREGEKLEIPLYRNGDPRPEVTVDWTTAPVNRSTTATPGVDFRVASGTVRFGPGERRKTIEVESIEDDLVEEGEGQPTEAFSLRFTGATGDAEINSGGQLAIIVMDDDARLLTAPPVSVAETAGEVVLNLGRDLHPWVEAPVVVEAVGGTASPGSDFTAPGRVELTRGDRTVALRIGLANDREVEGPETIRLQLREPDLRTPTRVVTIQLTSEDLDVIAPAVGFGTLRALRLGRSMTIPFTCSEACFARVELRLDRATARRLRAPQRVARGTATALAPGRVRTRLAVSRRTLARLRRVKRVRAAVRVTATDRFGNTRVVARGVTLRR